MSVFVEPKRNAMILKKKRHLKFAVHSQTEVEVFYVLQGWTDVMVEGERYRFVAGDFGVIFPHQIHEYLADSPDLRAILLIATEEQLIGKEEELFYRPPVSPMLAGIGDGHVLVRILRRACEEYRKSLPYREYLISGYLRAFTAEMMRILKLSNQSIARDDIAHRVLEYCNEHYSEPLTLDGLAEVLFISRSYLSYVFSKKLNTTFCHYLNSIRVEAACRFLRQPECPTVTELAEQIGFGSVRNFNRVFLRYKGISPMEYRRNHA